MRDANDIWAGMRHYLEDEEWQAAHSAVLRAEAALRQAEKDLQAVAYRISLHRHYVAHPEMAGLLDG